MIEIADINRRMTELARDRLEAMGATAGGLYDYYAARVGQGAILKPEDVAVARWIAENVQASKRILELCAGAAQLAHLLAIGGYAVSACEIDKARHAFAVALGQHMGSSCDVILAPWQKLDLSRFQLLVTLNAASSHVFPADTKWLVDYASQGGEFIIRPRQFGAGIPVEIDGLTATLVHEDVYHYAAK